MRSLPRYFWIMMVAFALAFTGCAGGEVEEDEGVQEEQVVPNGEEGGEMEDGEGEMEE